MHVSLKCRYLFPLQTSFSAKQALLSPSERFWCHAGTYFVTKQISTNYDQQNANRRHSKTFFSRQHEMNSASSLAIRNLSRTLILVYLTSISWTTSTHPGRISWFRNDLDGCPPGDWRKLATCITTASLVLEHMTLWKTRLNVSDIHKRHTQ
jgi:hypothetical protein